MEKVVVTGHTGFIGTHLKRELIHRGFNVITMDRTFHKVECDRIYHLACPSTTKKINDDPIGVMDIIFDLTRQALNICPSAIFINASTKGAKDVEKTPQGCYNVAKLAMEHYVRQINPNHINYRIPSVYGPGMHDDMFIRRCVLGNAFKPKQPEKLHYIAHIEDVVDAMINLTDINIEEITLGEIYESFSTGRRRIYRTTPGQ